MYPPHHYGGYELTCQDFVEHRRAAGDEVVVLTSDIRVPGVDDDAVDPPHVRRALQIYWHDHVVLAPPLRDCLARERANQAALAAVLDELRPDVVSAWHMGAMSLGLLTTCERRSLPITYVISDDWLIYAPAMDPWTKLWRRLRPLRGVGERLTGVPCGVPDLGATGRFCFITATTRRSAERSSPWRYPTSTVAYCGIDVERFPVGARGDADRPWSWRLLNVGRIDERKGIDTAIRALTHLPAEATLRVDGWGDDRYLDELRALAARLGLGDRVTFGVSPRQGLADRYATADVFVFPTRWAEPFGLVPLEAMACSTPVVATGTGGSSETLLHDVNALLVPVDDDAALAAAVTRLAEDEALRARLVAAGHVTAAELSVPRWLAVLDEWHEAAAAGERPPPDRPEVRAVVEASSAR
jgi:glycosyltransferase involved in cell wall biosynthesis